MPNARFRSRCGLCDNQILPGRTYLNFFPERGVTVHAGCLLSWRRGQPIKLSPMARKEVRARAASDPGEWALSSSTTFTTEDES